MLQQVADQKLGQGLDEGQPLTKQSSRGPHGGPIVRGSFLNVEYAGQGSGFCT
jgi:hypothetical protein